MRETSPSPENNGNHNVVETDESEDNELALFGGNVVHQLCVIKMAECVSLCRMP